MTATSPHGAGTAGAAAPLIAACLGATWFIWGTSYLAIKWALVSLPPFFQMGTRFVAAALVLGAWAAWRGARWPDRAQWRAAFVLGALMIGGGYGFTALAQTSVASGLVVAFIAVVPALVALGEWAYGLRPRRREAAGVVLGLVGVVLLARGQGFGASWPGLAAITVACLTWSLGTVWARQGLPRRLGGRGAGLAPGAAGYASQMLAGGVLLLALSWALGERPAWPPDARSAVSWLYLVVASTLLGFTAYMVLLERSTATLASSYTYVNPVIALALGVSLDGEVVGAGEWAAAAVVLAGVVLLLAGPGSGARERRSRQ
ncbi:MAG: EamA family transporter [Burkholderiaceae bacterium]|jgi:drug/metabolite transporter (DMT)-like permease|nr:EamA family transporter [Burkholderiaceae bacterium]